MNRFLYVIEPTATGFSAFVPDLPGCAVTGGTREGVEREIREAIEFHVTGLREEGMHAPEAFTFAGYVDVTV